MSLPTSATTVTPFSKLLALLCFILFPFIGFYLGIQYHKMLSPTPLPVLQKTTATCTTPTTCSEEAKRCPDGTYVFRQKPSCEFAACGKPIPTVPPLSDDIIRKAASKNEQIILQVSHKSGIAKTELTITTQTATDFADSFASGTFSGKNQTGWWLATKKADIWVVTSIGKGSPLCIDVTKYPKTLVPVCKNEKNDIISR